MTLKIESTFETLPTLKQILPNWPSLPNNLGGLPPPRPPPGTPMSMFMSIDKVLVSFFVNFGHTLYFLFLFLTLNKQIPTGNIR